MHAETIHLPDLTAFIERRGDRCYTDSRAVAHLFDKQHKNVLQAIEKNRRSRNPVIANHARLNFQPGSYPDGNGQMRPMYRMTAKGMAELTMGFSGEKASELRIRFVDAFDAVLEQVRDQTDTLWSQAQGLQLDEAASLAKGRVGSRLMSERKREKPVFQERLDAILATLQHNLFAG